MQENENDTEVVKSEEVAEVDTNAEQSTETSEAEESPQELKARLKRAEAKIERMKLDAKVEKKVEVKLKEKETGELDDTALDYLDLKGISEAEDLKVIEDIVKKTGLTVRQALKDEYVQTKLASNKTKREVKAATPSGTKRGGNQETDIASAVETFERTGKLPDDYVLKSAVINATVAKSSTNKPAWH